MKPEKRQQTTNNLPHCELHQVLPQFPSGPSCALCDSEDEKGNEGMDKGQLIWFSFLTYWTFGLSAFCSSGAGWNLAFTIIHPLLQVVQSWQQICFLNSFQRLHFLPMTYGHLIAIAFLLPTNPAIIPKRNIQTLLKKFPYSRNHAAGCRNKNVSKWMQRYCVVRDCRLAPGYEYCQTTRAPHSARLIL